MSRRVRYQVAVSLDGFIAGPNGEHDWIVMDPAIDFAALFNEFDTAVMGRKTYEVLTAQGGHGALPGLEVVVFSRTLPAATHPGVRIVNDDPREVVTALKAKPGRDIWLYGGGECFRSLLDAGLVDTVEVAVVPVLLGSGIPLLPPGGATKLTLADQKTLSASGIVALSYSIPGGVGPAPRIGYIKAAKARPKKTRTAEINDLEQRLAQAWVSRDRLFIEQLLDVDWTVIDPSGRVLTRQQVLDETFASTDRQIESMIVDDVKVRAFGAFAVATGRTRATGSYQGQRASVALRFTDVFHFRDDRWQIVASHGTTAAA
jgi:dihydrofolate reductase/ketosteroid isomerase-like protein